MRGRGHRLGIGWSVAHTVELGSGQCCKLTLVVGLWPGQEPGLGLGLLLRVKLLPESQAMSVWTLLWPMTCGVSRTCREQWQRAVWLVQVSHNSLRPPHPRPGSYLGLEGAQGPHGGRRPGCGLGLRSYLIVQCLWRGKPFG